jgi:alkylated DNA nucleotide flippase Atl1
MSDEATPTHEQVATLKAQVYALVQACPAGRVTTYG